MASSDDDHEEQLDDSENNEFGDSEEAIGALEEELEDVEVTKSFRKHLEKHHSTDLGCILARIL